ncbi:hypothetical protein X741_32725 [Mesorhizobium sp. LNHC229A00]|nr:hypothetical protein X741_32725 [Mesorhizobium sp. LNHC229A00]
MVSACGSNGSVANLFVSEHGKKNASAVEEHVMFKGRHFDQSVILLSCAGTWPTL